ncbi:hypothetical protein SJAV_06540 [Sulfurisphaera javensis]|uniref:Uncharacterized protein n=1 Tax=Sulfurisphaera javensis TaxID=2049879 RepID=A0AAT9GP58_9CREN
MISWLIGSSPPPWHYLNDLFKDYRNVAVYLNVYGNIELVKVSDIDEFYAPTSVLISGYHLLTLKPYYIKLKKFIAFPSKRLKVIRSLISRQKWRAMEFYYKEEFLVGWIIYDCEDCIEKQRLHLEVDEDHLTDEEIIERHLKIYNS